MAAALLAASATPALALEGFEWGGDFRFRITDLSDIPTNAGSFAFDSLFNRNRTRVWGQYSPNADTTLKLRITNEFRFYDKGRQYNEAWDPLSEVVPDAIYADFRNLADGKFAIKAGRQDLIYGTGKIILDGTPLDGSRTIYFDAIKATLNVASNKIDFLGIYNQDKDPLTINRQDTLRMIEQDEAALGLYGKNSLFEQAPFEYYWIYKTEDDSLTNTGTRDDAKFHTFGGRVMPKFGGGFSANVEAAYQTGDHGDHDTEGSLFDASLSFGPEIWGTTKPNFTAGYYYLSGDEADSSKNEGWHPVFSRWPQISELYVYSYVGTQYSIGGWSNLKTPYIGMDLTPFGESRLKFRYYKLYADENDGSGNGDERGDLITLVLNFKINKQLNGHLRGEWLNPGDYYASGTDDAHFVRLSMTYKF
jgi:hypothetical protein